jgi:hypothetical protein
VTSSLLSLKSGYPEVPMIETRHIETAPELDFDATVAGPGTAQLVLMLHGFCVSRHFLG